MLCHLVTIHWVKDVTTSLRKKMCTIKIVCVAGPCETEDRGSH